MTLSTYKKKRNFSKTPEPKGSIKKQKHQLIFVIQKHEASHLHYDFRLELNGVLKSWAVPKGPSLNPEEKRLAMMVEDHPYDYHDFEGTIPKGNYGGGTVMVWDRGTYEAIDAQDSQDNIEKLRAGLEKGDLKFILHGTKLNGEFALVRTHLAGEKSWLLIKKKDQFATDEDIRAQDLSEKTGRTMEEIADNVKPSKNKSVLKKPTIQEKNTIIDLFHIAESPMPHEITPMLATLTDKPFNDPDWIFEIKFDGYRGLAEVKDGAVRLYSRNNITLDKKFPSIVEELKNIQSTVIFDGEIVVLDENGRSHFQLLQNHQTGKKVFYYYVFDLLYYQGKNVMNLPLIQRKRLLQSIIPKKSIIRYSDHIEEHGKEFFRISQEKKLEGIIAKRKNSRYAPGKRNDDWLKIKTVAEQEAIICGYTEPKGSRKYFGALILGIYENETLRYVGHTGSGFDTALLKNLYTKFQPLVVSKSPFQEHIKTNAPVTWMKPELLCQVKFSEWTTDGMMRQPIFLGLREDKAAHEVSKEEPKKAFSKKSVVVTESNRNKVYFPEDGITKGDILDYYREISSVILPYLKDRPESLNRHPNGIEGPSFFQKDFSQGPSWIQTTTVHSEHMDKNIHYLLCQDLNTLLYLANLGCIELNPWSSCYKNPDYPDYLILDLDPGEISFKEVVRTAQCIKEILDKTDIDSYIKTSGKTGLHILLPMGAQYTFDQTKMFAQVLANIVYKELPQVTSVVRDPKKRADKVYIDFLQNRTGQTIAAPYSVRPVRHAPVSTPLEWKELNSKLHPTDFTIKTIFKRLKKKGDLWKKFNNHKGIDMLKCLSKLEKL